MKEKINGFLIENAISIFAVGDTVENIFQLHYGVTKYSAFICCQQPPFRGLRVVPCKLT